jgi:excisionase family DNA binding protein
MGMVTQSERKNIENLSDNLPVPRWIRVPQAVKYSNLSRAFVYRLLAEGKIKSISLKGDKKRGARLIDRESIDAYFDLLSEASN